MTWRTHTAFGYAFVLWIMTALWAISALSLISLVFVPDLATLADKDQNEKNNSVWSFLKHLSKGSFIDKSLRTIFKKMSDWEHRWLTHSFIFLFLLSIILSPAILILW